MDENGNKENVTGTSFAAPMVAGVFAVACSTFTGLCQDTRYEPMNHYDQLRSTGTVNTVYDLDGTVLTTYGDKARFITQQW